MREIAPATRKNKRYCISMMLETIMTDAIAMMAAIDATLFSWPSRFPSFFVSERLSVKDDDSGTHA